MTRNLLRRRPDGRRPITPGIATAVVLGVLLAITGQWVLGIVIVAACGYLTWRRTRQPVAAPVRRPSQRQRP
jgi:hypothetical protein